MSLETGQAAAEVEVSIADLIARDIITKVDAGAQLVYAIFHHPQALELMKSDFMTRGLSTAYGVACDAYGVRN